MGLDTGETPSEVDCATHFDR